MESETEQTQTDKSMNEASEIPALSQVQLDTGPVETSQLAIRTEDLLAESYRGQRYEPGGAQGLRVRTTSGAST